MSGRSSDYALALSPAELARYRYMAARAREEEAADWAAAGIVPGARVGDVGCGPCAIAVAMAEAVGPAGAVDAVDREPAAIAMAEQVIAAAGVSNVRPRLGGAEDTGLPAGSYDTVVLRHVLAHNGGREEAITSHLATLVRPGGWVYVLDIDISGAGPQPDYPVLAELEERYRAFHLARGNDLLVGLRLESLLRAAGLVDVRGRRWKSIVHIPPGIRPPAWAAVPAMLAAGFVSAEDVKRFDTALSEIDTAPKRPRLAVPLCAAFGRRLA
jgi:SAM-dependent methyltransferase